MELYRGTVTTLEFYAQDGMTVTGVEYSYNGGDPVVDDNPMEDVDDPQHYTSDSLYLDQDGRLEVTWTFTVGGSQYSEKKVYNVVTPYAPLRWIENHLGNRLSDDAEERRKQIAEVESSVRLIIDGHTGQSFGKIDEVKRVRGYERSALILPQRLASVRTVNGLPSDNFEIDDDGLKLRFNNYYSVFTREDVGVTFDPSALYNRRFTKGRTYEIDGTWGWEEVPPAVTEAAKLLVNDYACTSQQYKDSYLESMTAADWRLQFLPDAFFGTGNARADLLLRDYNMHFRWVAI